MSPSGLSKMSNKMLIDASHQEETRVVVTRGNRIEEFDFESEHKKQLKANIYLARVTRVEPSLQAAFVEYGGNRHGFLAFSEIHPDYYQIPVADRIALLEAEEQAAMQDNEINDLVESETGQKKRARQKAERRTSKNRKAAATDTDIDSVSGSLDSDSDDILIEDSTNEEETIEVVGAEDALEEVPIQRIQRRDYKIQEVIKRRQILLVQVMKEERGNKGAALTTYLSMAGRYSVLMPNTARGGGISRKITNAGDRKRLREIVKELSVPKGMGIILRTAGANRTKTEVKRDYEYLMRLWENVRNLTLGSIAPALVYEEGNLIKRSIRDLYNKDIDEILVAGDKGYREAKDFMRMLMPSYAKVVQPYRDKLHIFARNGIETQLDRMLQPEVSLKSGGYLVINQTEALVAIDVNSGRSTREHSVEETAIQTNLEAAEEIARQLRLRDLAGLVVIDFIDMLEKRNIRAVEKKLRDCLKEDRARIQVGRISHFGLMEMSRQRLRTSVLESTTQPCPHCAGTGYIRSESSVALHVVRSIEEYLLRNSNNNIIVRTPVSTALYVLNHKRKVLANLEEQFGLTIDIEADDAIGSQHLAIYKGSTVQETSKTGIQSPADEGPVDEDATLSTEKPDAGDAPEEQCRRHRKHRGESGNENIDKQAEARTEKISSQPHGDEERKRRHRRGRRGGRRNHEHDQQCRIHLAEPVGPFAGTALAELEQERNPFALAEADSAGSFTLDNGQKAAATATLAVIEEQAVSSDAQMNRTDSETAIAESPVIKKEAAGSKGKGKRKITSAPEKSAMESAVQADIPEVVKQEAEEKRQPKHRSRKKAEEEKTVSIIAVHVEKGTEPDRKPPVKTRAPRKKKPTADTEKPDVMVKKAAEPVAVSSTDDTAEPAKAKRAGWWQRKGFF